MVAVEGANLVDVPTHGQRGCDDCPGTGSSEEVEEIGQYGFLARGFANLLLHFREDFDADDAANAAAIQGQDLFSLISQRLLFWRLAGLITWNII